MAGGQVPMDEIDRVVKDISGKARYPISSFDELAAVLGGESASVNVGGRGYTVGYGRQLLPAAVFPIASEADFIAKISLLRSRGRQGTKQDQDQSVPQIQPDGTDEPYEPGGEDPLLPPGPWC